MDELWRAGSLADADKHALIPNIGRTQVAREGDDSLKFIVPVLVIS
jgi:hypothetical protein